MQKIKERAERFLKEKVYNELCDIHYVSTFLHPSFKELLPLDPIKRNEVHQSVRQMCDKVHEPQNMEETTTTYSPAKKFREWRSSSVRQRDEMEKYLNMDVPADCKDILLWWKTQSTFLPKLSIIAKQVLCIPASSATSERNFSRAGLIVTDRRSCIDPDHVNNLLFINNNSHN